MTETFAVAMPFAPPRRSPILQLLLLAVQVVAVLVMAAVITTAMYFTSVALFGQESVAAAFGQISSYGTKQMRSAPAPAQQMFFALVAALFVCLLAGSLAIAWLAGRRNWREPLALCAPAWLPPRWGLVAFVLAMPAYLALASVTIRLFYPDFSTWFFVPADPAGLAISFLAVVVLAPLAEELLFRGWIYSGLRKAAGKMTAIAVTTLLFAFAHSDGGLIYPAAILIPGLALALVREWTGSTWMSFAAHASYNAWAWVLVLGLGERI